MTDANDVVIIGGGAAGCAAAYYLGLAGICSTIIEGDAVASQASGYAAGLLNPLQGSDIPGLLGPLAMESFKMHHSLAEELPAATGIDYESRIVTQVKMAMDESEIPDLEATFRIFDGVPGFEAQRLDSAELHSLEPRLGPWVISGVYTKGNVGLDSYKYTLALAAGAEKLGATVRPGIVRGLERSGGRVTKVLLEDGEISCGALVLAMGPWSRMAEPWLGAYIPVDPLKGEILRVEPSGPPLAHDFSGGGSSLYPKPDGLVWCGTTEEWRGFDRQPLESTRQTLMERAARLMPDLAQARLSLHTACLRPVTPDWLPIIGKPPGYENVILATGAGKKGIMLSPGFGKAVADLISSGETQMPVSDFTPGRFSQPDKD
jgi:glycine oxidase